MKKNLMTTIIPVIAISVISTLIMTGCNRQPEPIDETTSAPPTSAFEEDTEPCIPVDGDEFAKKYIFGMKKQYIKNGNNSPRDALIDRLHEKIDAFYDAIMSGITQTEYDAFERDIDAIVTEINGGNSPMNAPAQTTVDKQDLLNRIDVLLLDDLRICRVQIEYSEMSRSQRKKRLKLVDELIEKVNQLTEDIENGTITPEEGKKQYDSLQQESTTLLRWVTTSYRNGPDD